MAQAIPQGTCRRSWGDADPAPLLAAAISTPRPGSNTQSSAAGRAAAGPTATAGCLAVPTPTPVRPAAGLVGSLARLSRRDRRGSMGEVPR